MPAFKALAEEYRINGWIASYGGCPPLTTVYRLDRPRRHKCRQFNDTVMQLISDSNIKVVFLVSRWSLYTEGHDPKGPQSGKTNFIGSENHNVRSRASSKKAFSEGLEKTMKFLVSRRIDVVLLEQAPEHRFLVPTILAKIRALRQEPKAFGRIRKNHYARQSYIASQFDAVAKQHKVMRIDLASRLCNGDTCLMSDGKAVLYSDYHHLSKTGALWISGLIAPVFESLSNTRSGLTQ